MKTLLIILFFPLIVLSQSLSADIQYLIHQKKFAEAEEIAKQYLEKYPDNLQIIELLGDSYAHQRDWDNAISHYKKLVELEPKNANFHYKYGGALGMKALTISKLKALSLLGDLKSAFLKAAELDPEHIDARWALVELYMQLPGIVGGSKMKSLKYADELEALSKVDGYLAKGYIYEYDDEPAKAEYYYKKAIEVGGSITCYEELSSFYENNNQPTQAVATLEESYQKHNKNALHYQIGKVCADYNIQLEKGERCLKNYIKNYSAKDGVPIEWAYFRLAQINKNKENKQEALMWIDKALNTRSDFKQALEERKKILQL